MYEKLIEWAKRHNMMFKVTIADRNAEVWMCDKADGFIGAECCNVHQDGTVTWLGFRFRLRKNEQFIKKFVTEFLRQEDPMGTADWVGYDDSPQFVLPTSWKSERGEWAGVKGTFHWIDKIADEKRKEMEDAGCTLLKSYPAYAPERVSDVVFIPRKVRFSYC